MAKGGVDGEGTPFILGYQSVFLELMTGMRCNQVLFMDGNEYVPEGMYVCNTPWATSNILEEGDFTSKFKQGDYFMITATALDANYDETDISVSYYLADYRSENEAEWILNNSWEWFDLSPLGKCGGFFITVQSSDDDGYGFGPNTATYFAIDKITLSMPSEDIIIDLNNPTNPESIEFNEEGYWAETYNEADYNYIEFDLFGLSRYADNSWGAFWNGFTISKSTDNDINHSDWTNNQWGCMAKGGVDGEGTPFILGYYDDYNSKASGPTNQILFMDGEKYAPQGMYVCNTPWATNNILFDGAFSSAFTQGSYLTLTAHALNEEFEPTGVKATYYMCDYRTENAWTLNEGWEWFDLTPLGQCNGFYITMESTDDSGWGPNTSTYFALDKITLRPATGEDEDVDTSVKETVSVDYAAYLAGNVISVKASAGTAIYVYDVQGKSVYSATAQGEVTLIDAASFAKGIYVVKAGEQSFKIIK